MNVPRPQHYGFAHKLLAHEAHHNPERLWDSVTGPSWSAYLAQVWTIAGDGEPEKIAIKGLGVEGILLGTPVFRAEGVELVFIHMPPPEAPTEAFWIVLARQQGTTRPLRYFVFEQRAADPKTAIMSEWRGDGSRINYGDAGSDLSVDAVRDMVMLEVLSSQASRPQAAPPMRGGAPMMVGGGADLSRPFTCDLSTFNKVRIWLGIPFCGIGLIWWLLFLKDPRVLDPQGVTLRSGRRFSWGELTDVKRIRVVGAYTGARRDYYIQMWFGGQIVNLTPSELNNGDEALAYLEAVLGARLRDDY